MSTTETKVKERPILFSGPMVQAILEGRKTQTRRVINPQPPGKQFFLYKTGQDIGFYMPECTTGYRMTGAVGVARDAMAGTWPKNGLWRCPYGSVGERLWVRETWAPMSTFDPSAETGALYRATEADQYRDKDFNWKPSIHMPRWASRITLEITGVRVERLNDISYSDAIAEGAPHSHPSIDAVSRSFGFEDFSRSWFGQLWELIHGVGSWKFNPFVWVIEFKQIENL